MEAIRNVLDKGFVRLVEHMGGDRAVVQAARVSFGQGLKGEDADKKLISYLLKHRHTSPFEQAVFKFHVKAPVFVARQWFRHRMASYNELSQRYAQMDDEFYNPARWRAQSKTNKQGSDEAHLDHARATWAYETLLSDAMKTYLELIDMGVAKEMARLALPISAYTQFYVTLNAHALMHFIRLRSEAHAQYEIRVYSDALFQEFKKAMPWTADAFSSVLEVPAYPGIFTEVPA